MNYTTKLLGDAVEFNSSFGWDRRSLFIIVLTFRVRGQEGRRVGRVSPGVGRSQCSAERSGAWLHHETVPANENRIGDTRELQQHGAEPGVQAPNVDTSSHASRLSILGPK